MRVASDRAEEEEEAVDLLLLLLGQRLRVWRRGEGVVGVGVGIVRAGLRRVRWRPEWCRVVELNPFFSFFHSFFLHSLSALSFYSRS